MKFVMVIMAFMFYKVPSGLGIYFITSSLWSIGERLLLPKMAKRHAAASSAEGGETDGNGNGPGPKGDKPTPPRSPSRLATFWERVLDEARKDSTYRRLAEERDTARGDKDSKDSGRDRGRDRGKPRARPGKR
jgi:YidC/Oxa1 family membrane protein insertase